MPVTDTWSVYDNSYAKPEFIARKYINKEIEIINESVWLKMQEEIQ